MAEQLISGVFLVFVWLVAPALIARSKGRRWWVWLLLSIPFPMLGLLITIFMHPHNKNTSSIS